MLKFTLRSENRQKGVSLIITFFITTIMLAVVLGISVILYNRVKIVSNIGNSVSSLNAADSGLEKTLYFHVKRNFHVGNRGICDICTQCSSSDCTSCRATPLAPNGCLLSDCGNCKVSYISNFSGKSYNVNATITPDPITTGIYVLGINSKGSYRSSSRSAEVTYKRYGFPNCLAESNGPFVPLEGTMMLTQNSNVKIIFKCGVAPTSYEFGYYLASNPGNKILLGDNTTPPDTEFDTGTFPISTEIVLYVYYFKSLKTWSSFPASSNSNNRVQADVRTISSSGGSTTYQVSFEIEDTSLELDAGEPDFNDPVFNVIVTPQ